MKKGIAACIAALINLQSVFADDTAVALLYHHVSAETPPSTSVSPEVFAQHLDYLESGGYSVMQLSRIVTMLNSGSPLPERSVAITFDDAYQSVHDTAMPMLTARGWPFTVFVNTDKSTRESSTYLDWEELRHIIAGGGDVQNHGHSHDHMAFPRAGECMTTWRQRVRADITTAQQLITQNLGVTPTLFAYPYGEFSPELQDEIARLGLTGVGQQSGAIGTDSDFLGLPRHPFYTGADGLERFAQRIQTKPLYISAEPRGPMRVERNSRITLEMDLGDQSPVNCFFDGQPVTISDNRISDIGPFPKARARLNCTKSDGAGAYLWWSYLFIRQ